MTSRPPDAAAVYRRALALPEADRAAFLAGACGGNTALLREVESMIAADRDSTAIMPSSGGPRTIGFYRIEERIGAGGMGEVWAATDTRLGRRVAVKFLPKALTADPDRVERFRKEARATSALNHPNVLTVHDVGESDGVHYIVTELVEGHTLRSRISRGPVPLVEAIELSRQVASGLAAAHAAGVVHRDIKPDNVMVRRDGLVKVLDFGLAKLLESSGAEASLTGDGAIVGTPSYMPPEQLRGEPVDERADVWAVGVLLYELVTGRRPFQADRVTSVITQILTEEPRWPASGVPEPVVTIVRKALEKDRSRRHRSIEELKGELEALGAELNPVPAEPRARRRKRLAVAIAGLLLVLAGGAATVKLQRAESPGEGAAIRSIAVLPFLNLSGTEGSDHLSDGMTEELITALARLEGISVVARTSSFALKGETTDVRAAARRLNAQAVVEGSVKRIGSRLRVTATLVNPADGFQLWSNTYDREMTDVFAIQDEIATAVAEALSAKLGTARPVRPVTRDMLAYEHYLRGRQAAQKWEARAVEQAAEHYRQALARDPSFSRAWAGLADVYSTLDHRAGLTNLRPIDGYRLASQAAERALALDPDSSEALSALGHIQAHLGEMTGAERNLRRAVELDPNSASARLWYAMYFRALGDPAGTREQLLKARELDPLFVLTATGGATSLWAVGDYELAETFGRASVELAPDYAPSHLGLARALGFLGRFDEASASIDRAAALSKRPVRIAAERALLLCAMGRREEAVALMREIDSTHAASIDVADDTIPLLRAWAAAGEPDEAIAWLERAVRLNPYYARINVGLPPHPLMEGVRRDPRYAAALRQLGLPVH
jgi:eukaryotic-like serine/threonine-protein kinase